LFLEALSRKQFAYSSIIWQSVQYSRELPGVNSSLRFIRNTELQNLEAGRCSGPQNEQAISQNSRPGQIWAHSLFLVSGLVSAG
jgi:hypothetical protein